MKKNCPLCDDGWDGYETPVVRCGFCKGTGRVSMKEYMRYVRAHRKVENRG